MLLEAGCQSLTSHVEKKKKIRLCLWFYWEGVTNHLLFESEEITPQIGKIESVCMKSWWLCCLVDGWRCSDNRLMGSLSFLPFSTEARVHSLFIWQSYIWYQPRNNVTEKRLRFGKCSFTADWAKCPSRTGRDVPVQENQWQLLRQFCYLGVVTCRFTIT